MSIRPAIVAGFAAGVFIFAAFPLGAADVIGRITYREGAVELVREGATLDARLVKEGLDLANFDLLKTARDGRVELRITSPAAPAATITVSPRTQFSLEIGKVGQQQQTTVDLVAGSVAVKCAMLAGGQALRVLTEGAALGVRGTSFTVSAPASGDILVTCDEGVVECTDEKGGTLAASAGEAIEKPAGRPLARLAVAAVALADARRAWLERQDAVLKRDPLKVVNTYRILLNRQRCSFDRQYRAFVRYQRIFDAWDAEDRTGSSRRPIAQLREKVSLAVRLWALRGTLFRLERTYVRLLELKEYCEEGGISGRVGLQKSETFFRILEVRGRGIELRRALVRWRSWQFALRNDGRVPGGAFDPVDWKTFFKNEGTGRTG